MNNEKEIKNANRKAMPKFILVTIISALIGAAIGFLGAMYGIDALSDGLKTAGDFFGKMIAPWLSLALAVIMPIIYISVYKKAKKQIAEWDGEDESVPDLAEGKLSVLIWISSAVFIFSFFLLASVYSGGFSSLTEKENAVPFLVAIVSFLAIMIETITLQQKCLDAVKKINPEKANVSVYDMKFQKKWVDSCDEAEKMIIGKCAFKAYSATNAACCILSVVLAVAALLFKIGFLPSLVVCVIWLVNLSVYCKAAKQIN